MQHLRRLRPGQCRSAIEHEIRDARYGWRFGHPGAVGQRDARFGSLQPLLGSDSCEHASIIQVLAKLEVRGKQTVEQSILVRRTQVLLSKCHQAMRPTSVGE